MPGFIPRSWSNGWLRLPHLLSLFSQNEINFPIQLWVHWTRSLSYSMLYSRHLPYNWLVLNDFELNFFHTHSNNVKAFSCTSRSYSDKLMPNNVYYTCVLSLNILQSNETLYSQSYDRKNLHILFPQDSLSMPIVYTKNIVSTR